MPRTIRCTHIYAENLPKISAESSSSTTQVTNSDATVTDVSVNVQRVNKSLAINGYVTVQDGLSTSLQTEIDVSNALGSDTISFASGTVNSVISESSAPTSVGVLEELGTQSVVLKFAGNAAASPSTPTNISLASSEFLPLKNSAYVVEATDVGSATLGYRNNLNLYSVGESSITLVDSVESPMRASTDDVFEFNTNYMHTRGNRVYVVEYSEVEGSITAPSATATPNFHAVRVYEIEDGGSISASALLPMPTVFSADHSAAIITTGEDFVIVAYGVQHFCVFEIVNGSWQASYTEDVAGVYTANAFTQVVHADGNIDVAFATLASGADTARYLLRFARSSPGVWATSEVDIDSSAFTHVIQLEDDKVITFQDNEFRLHTGLSAASSTVTELSADFFDDRFDDVDQSSVVNVLNSQILISFNNSAAVTGTAGVNNPNSFASGSDGPTTIVAVFRFTGSDLSLLSYFSEYPTNVNDAAIGFGQVRVNDTLYPYPLRFPSAATSTFRFHGSVTLA